MKPVHFYQDEDNYVPIFDASGIDWGCQSCGDGDGHGDGNGTGNGSGEATAFCLSKSSEYDYTKTSHYYYMGRELKNEN